jgi:hypothetical protein
MDPLTIIAIVNASIVVVTKGLALLADIQAGRINPEDIPVDALRAPDVEEIEKQVRAGTL